MEMASLKMMGIVMIQTLVFYPQAEDSSIDGIDQNWIHWMVQTMMVMGMLMLLAEMTIVTTKTVLVNPGAEEDFTDGIDQDCDGYADMSDVECGSRTLRYIPRW